MRVVQPKQAPLEHGIVAGSGHFLSAVAEQDLALAQGLGRPVEAGVHLWSIHVAQ